MLYTKHSRSFRENRYVYPVLSRRSKGISVGINLNPDRVCNFDCLYCQVGRNDKKGAGNFSDDRKSSLPLFTAGVDRQRLCLELKETLDFVKTGGLFSIPPFDRIPSELRRLSDIAISGDGEPTTFPDFYEAIEEILKVKKDYHDDLKIVLITNASGLNRLKVRDALDLMYSHKGEVWAKLDAGSDAYYEKVSRTNVPFKRIVSNVTSIAKRHPVVIQSCFNRIKNTPPPLEEIECYCNRLKEIREDGGMIRLVQIYTIARPPAEDYVTALSKEELELIAQEVQRIAGLKTEIY